MKKIRRLTSSWLKSFLAFLLSKCFKLSLQKFLVDLTTSRIFPATRGGGGGGRPRDVSIKPKT